METEIRSMKPRDDSLSIYLLNLLFLLPILLRQNINMQLCGFRESKFGSNCSEKFLLFNEIYYSNNFWWSLILIRFTFSWNLSVEIAEENNFLTVIVRNAYRYRLTVVSVVTRKCMQFSCLEKNGITGGINSIQRSNEYTDWISFHDKKSNPRIYRFIRFTVIRVLRIFWEKE